MVTEYNVDIKKYYDVMKYILDQTRIIVYPHDKDGFLQANNKTYDTADLSRPITSILDKVFSNYNDKQFIASQMSHPDSIFFRLFSKNIPKCEKIKTFAENCKIKYPTYIINETRAKKVVKKFLNELSSTMRAIAKRYDLKSIESTIKLYYDAKNDLLADNIQIISDADIENFITKFNADKEGGLGEKLKLHLGKKSSIVSLNKRTADVVEFVCMETIKKFQDTIAAMVKEYDSLFEGVNIGRLNAQFETFIEDEKSRILLSKISVKFSPNVADRIKVMKGVRSNHLLYKLSQMEYDSDAYNKLLKY